MTCKTILLFFPFPAKPLHRRKFATVTGACWEATYSTPTLNQGGTFRAKGD